MRKFSKGLTTVLCVMVIILALTGCASSMSMTFNPQTGDTVNVTLDTSEGFTLSEADDLMQSEDDYCGFYVKEDDDTILLGIFIDEEEFDDYKDIYDNMNMSEIIEEDSANGITWIFYSTDGVVETGRVINILVWIDGSDTGILIGASILRDYDTAKKALDSLTFSVE
ncbi:MAG: hypothetical protein K2K96_12105 [Lachnospiraceae bacterium]|nr:hypothetical protein [Lachnospiraceae bacterium]